MKKFSIIIVAMIVLLAVLPLTGMTEDIPIAGLVTPGEAPVFAYGDATYTVKYPVIAVFKSDPGISGTRKAKDGNYVLHYASNPAAFKGATYYAMGIGNKYKGGSEAADANLDETMASASITGASVTLIMENERAKRGNRYYDGMVPFIKLADGTQINGGHAQWPNGPFMVKTKGSYVTAWMVDSINKEIATVGEGGRIKFAAQIN